MWVVKWKAKRVPGKELGDTAGKWRRPMQATCELGGWRLECGKCSGRQWKSVQDGCMRVYDCREARESGCTICVYEHKETGEIGYRTHVCV